MKQKTPTSTENANKHESRFPWIFKTDGVMKYFGKIEKHVYFYSSKEVDTKLISEDIEKSRILGVSIDVLRNEIVRVLSICTKNSVFVISLNQGFVISSLSQYLSSLTSKMTFGYDLEKPLQLLKQSYGITIQAKDLHVDEEYSAKFKELENREDIREYFTKSTQDIQAVSKFDTIHSLSNIVMSAITQPAVLAYYFITEVDDNSNTEFPLQNQVLFQFSSSNQNQNQQQNQQKQKNQDKLISPPFALLPNIPTKECNSNSNLSMSLCERYGIFSPQDEFPDEKNNQPEEEQEDENEQNQQNNQNEIRSPHNNLPTKPNQLQIQTNPNSPQRNTIPTPKMTPKTIEYPNRSELELQPSKRSKSPSKVQEQVPSKPLVIVKNTNTPRNVTPPPQQPTTKDSPDISLLKIEGRKRKDSLPLSSQIVITKMNKRHNEFCDPICMICRQTLNSTVSLAAHIITNHIEESHIFDVFKRANCPSYVCSNCNQFFMDKSVFIMHIVDKHTKEIAQLMTQIPINEQRDQILQFFKRLTEEVNDIIPDESWDSLRRLERDMMKKNIITTTQNCPLCNMSFQTYADFLYHCYITHNG